MVFYEKPLVKFERILMTTLGGFPGTYPVFRESMVAWFNEKLWAKSKLRADLDIPTREDSVHRASPVARGQRVVRLAV